MEVFKNIPGVLTEMGTGLVNLGSSLVTMLKMFSGVGLLDMIKFGLIMAEVSAGVAALGLATQLISTPSLEAMNVLLEKLQGISEWGSGASESISALAKSLVEVSLAINDIPILKTIMLKTSMDSLGVVLNASKTITKENIEPTKELIQAAKEFYIVQSEAKPMFNDPLIQTLNLVKNSINGLASSFNTGDKGEGQKVTLIIDGKSIAAVLKPHLNSNTKSFLVGPSGA